MDEIYTNILVVPEYFNDKYLFGSLTVYIKDVLMKKVRAD